jgi:hypothetical protein
MNHPRVRFRSLLLLPVFLAALGFLWPRPAPTVEPEAPVGKKAEVDPKALLARLRKCRTPAEVEDLLGKPKHVARQILFSRYIEQWTYGDPFPVWIDFDWPKGKEKQIQTVQPLSAPQR